MRCIADGPWPAALRTGSTSPREMVTVVACTTTWRVEGGRLAMAEAGERWKPAEQPVEVAGVQLGDDLDFRRQDADLVVLGAAVAPGGRPVREMQVAAGCGAVAHRSLVLGDRVWEKSWGRLRISEPAPFSAMPIGNDRAFGGVAATAQGGMPHGVNPAGRGFHAAADTVPGSPLPNLEDPAAPIRRWTDRPLPSLWYKPAGAPPLADPPADPVAYACAAGRAALRDAPPALSCPPDRLGAELVLEGFDAAGALRWPLPRPGGWASVQIGERRARLPLAIARIVAMPAERALAVTWSARFRWLMEPRDERSVVVGWDG